MFYKGFAVASKGAVYVGENTRVGFYQQGKLVDDIQVGGATYRRTAYEFTIMDDHIYAWTGDWLYIITPDGEEVGRRPGERNLPEGYRGRNFEAETEDGACYAMENRWIGRPKIACTYPDGSQEIVFRIPLAVYLLKITFPMRLLGFIVWIVKRRLWEKTL